MKKAIAILITLVMTLAVVIPMVSSGGTSEAPSFADTTDLIADGGDGIGIDVGDVNVWNDNESIYVEYLITEEDWYLLETHVHVGDSKDDFPMSGKGKNKNPIPGHFDYSTYFNIEDYEQDYIEVIPNEFDVDDEVLIAAHSVVAHVAEGCFYVISDETNTWTNSTTDGDAVIANPQPSAWADQLDYDFSSSGAGAKWIWATAETTAVENYSFGNEFLIPGLYPIEINGIINITCDNAYNLTVNSDYIGGDWGVGSWKTVETYYIGENLTCGSNTLKVLAENYGGPAGLIYEAYICYTVVDQEETAWGNGTRFTDKGNWGMYFDYTIQDVKSVTLVYKDPVTWDTIGYDTWGTLYYVPSGPMFVFDFYGYNLEVDEEYSLIYYADPWPGNNPGALLGTTATSGSDANIYIGGSIDLGMDLPDPADVNTDGAKIWLVKTSDYDEATNSMIAWNPDYYLFEEDMDDRVFYDDTGVILLSVVYDGTGDLFGSHIGDTMTFTFSNDIYDVGNMRINFDGGIQELRESWGNPPMSWVITGEILTITATGVFSNPRDVVGNNVVSTINIEDSDGNNVLLPAGGVEVEHA